jgi:hypothetical protein
MGAMVSDWTKWIGNETVGMVVAVVTAVIAVFALSGDLGKVKVRLTAPGSQSGGR